MSLHNQSLYLIKALYLIKIEAMQKNDANTLSYLKEKHPEIFDREFLYQFLIKYLKETNQAIDPFVHKKIKEKIEQFKILH